MEAVAELRGDHAWVVEVEAADGDGVVLEDAVVGDVEDACGELPVFGEGVASGDVEGGVHGETVSVVGAFILPGEAVGESGAVIHVGREPGAYGQVGGEAGVQRVALVVVDGGVGEAEVAGGVGGSGAGEAANDVAALLGDLVGVGEMELAEFGQLRGAEGPL